MIWNVCFHDNVMFGCDNFINHKFDRMNSLLLRMFLERASVLWQICWVVKCLLRQTKIGIFGAFLQQRLCISLDGFDKRFYHIYKLFAAMCCCRCEGCCLCDNLKELDSGGESFEIKFVPENGWALYWCVETANFMTQIRPGEKNDKCCNCFGVETK